MYEKMKKELLEALKDMLADSFKVKTYTVFKNGKEVEAFLITEEDSAVSPTFYYKNYLDDYMKGVSVEDLAKEIVAAYFFASQQYSFNATDFRDFNAQKNRIVYKVVNAKEYAEQLPNIPHVKFFDLAIIFYCIINISKEESISYVITNSLLEIWGISKEELYEIAHQNFPKVLPLQISPITETIYEGFKDRGLMEETIETLPDDFIYVVTNKYQKFGFANIFYPKLLETFAKRFGSFYIIPSSTEEALLFPTSTNMGVDEIKYMVRTINGDKNIIQPDIFLSNSIYHYDAETGKIDAYL